MKRFELQLKSTSFIYSYKKCKIAFSVLCIYKIVLIIYLPNIYMNKPAPKLENGLHKRSLTNWKLEFSNFEKYLKMEKLFCQ